MIKVSRRCGLDFLSCDEYSIREWNVPGAPEYCKVVTTEMLCYALSWKE